VALLYYWRGDNYRRDLDHGAAYHLNQASAALHEIQLGESVWAFTRRADGAYALAAELVAKAKTRNPPGYRYGPYRLWGDLERSRYFQVSEQPDITGLIRGLSISAKGDRLGRAFQGHAAVRRITVGDDSVLRSFASTLPLEPRSRLMPEEQLEANLQSGDDLAAAALIDREGRNLSDERRRYLMTRAVKRSRSLVEELRELYAGRCQLCRWAPRSIYQTDLCEGHHVRWLGRGGEDSLGNLVLLCPNHHRAVHRLDAQFDWNDMGFVFAESVQRLELVAHELAATEWIEAIGLGPVDSSTGLAK
jgi:5-methylcytosine-specific restriction protein A